MAFVPASSIAPASVTVAGTVGISGQPIHVDVDNLPATQPVSGTVAVSNFPATQPVSGTVAVSSVGGTVTTDGSGHTQPVSGSVSVSNFPATQPVSGTVTANQGTAGAAWPISAASLPLPTGAATDASLTNGNQRVGGTVTVDGSAVTQPVSGSVSVSNLPATQAVSVASLPLPAGAATEATLERVKRSADEVALKAITGDDLAA